MDFPLLGVIPVNTSQVNYAVLSLSKCIAIGIQHSVYIFDTVTGENICRLNHYPHITNTAIWHPQDFMLFSGDTGGDILQTTLKSSNSSKHSIPIGFTSLSHHLTNHYLFIQYKDKILIYNSSTWEETKQVLVNGFKTIPDYFCPLRIIVLDEEIISVIRSFIKNPVVSSGKVKNAVDVCVNQGVMNSVYILMKSQLIEYDIFYLREIRVVNCYPYEMMRILSSYSDQVWTLARSGIVTPLNALIENSFLCVSSCPGFTGSKLPICFVKDPLELCYGLVSSTIEVVSRVHLGISLSFWSSGLIQEKVLVFYQGDYINCFSFSKERIVRKIRMPGLTKMCCHSAFCYIVKHATSYELIEWKMSSGETKTIKNYTCPIESICINSQGTHLAVVTTTFLEIFELTQPNQPENLSISNISSAIWAEENLVLYLSTPTVFVKVQKDSQNFTTTILLTIDLQVTEILETSGEIYLKNYNNWGKYVIGNTSLVNEPIETIDEINICHTKAEFKEFGLLYRNQNKDIHPLVMCKNLAMENSFGIDNVVMNSKKFDKVLRNPPKSFLDKLFVVAEFENSLRNLMMWKVLGEIIENNLDTSEDVVSKPRTRARENSFQGSPNNVTPARRVAKRSTSPLSKSRKSITPQRIVKLQSDPKELIQLAVDTSTLLSSTQNFQKETPPKMFYILENSPNYKTALPTAVDFLNTDKKALVKRLIGSNDEKDMLIGCIVAGMLGRQELQKAIETACAKLEGSTGILMNLAVGSKTKAWEILQEKECSEDVAYFSKVSGRVDGFFPWIIELYESGFGFDSALHLLCAGYTGLAMQILCKINEDRLAYWISKYMENECRLKKEVPSDFEGWFYELGPPRFKSRMDEELQSLSQKYEKNLQSN